MVSPLDGVLCMSIMNNSSYRLSEINILNNLRHFYHIKTTGWHITETQVEWFIPTSRHSGNLQVEWLLVHKFHVSAIKEPKEQMSML